MQTTFNNKCRIRVTTYSKYTKEVSWEVFEGNLLEAREVLGVYIKSEHLVMTFVDGIQVTSPISVTVWHDGVLTKSYEIIPS